MTAASTSAPKREYWICYDECGEDECPCECGVLVEGTSAEDALDAWLELDDRFDETTEIDVLVRERDRATTNGGVGETLSATVTRDWSVEHYFDLVPKVVTP